MGKAVTEDGSEVTMLHGIDDLLLNISSGKRGKNGYNGRSGSESKYY